MALAGASSGRVEGRQLVASYHCWSRLTGAEEQSSWHMENPEANQSTRVYAREHTTKRLNGNNRIEDNLRTSWFAIQCKSFFRDGRGVIYVAQSQYGVSLLYI